MNEYIPKVPEVDLNLRHYIGERSDVIKEVKGKVKEYLQNPNIPQSHRAIYSAIYNGLNLYQTTSELSISGESEDNTFLENTLDDFSETYNYLSEKYNSKDPNEPKVIKIKGRIKSPVSFMDKLQDTIADYVKKGKDLSTIGEDLKDIIGVRIIITPPKEVVELDEKTKSELILDAIEKDGDEELVEKIENAPFRKAQSDFCYRVFNDFLEHKGIRRQINNIPDEGDYEFLTVDTKQEPNKQKKIKDRPKKEGYEFDPASEGVYIPSSRPQYIEAYDKYFKDYRMYPKKKGYQRLHQCAKPPYASKIAKESLPKYIIPPKDDTGEPSIEIQCSLDDEDQFAEYGAAAHTSYKDRNFHRLAIPIGLKTVPDTYTLRTARLDESMKDFYGFSFDDKFGIPYKDFLLKFNTTTRDEILAGNVTVEYDENLGDYRLTKSPVPTTLAVSKDTSLPFVANLLNSTSTESLERFFEANGITDNIRYVGTNNPSDVKRPAIDLIKFNQKSKKFYISKDGNPKREPTGKKLKVKIKRKGFPENPETNGYPEAPGDD